MFNLMAFLDSNSDKLSEKVKTEIKEIKQEHDKQMCQKGYSDVVRRETPIS